MVDRRGLPSSLPDFDELVLPHRDAAYNLALCIMTSTADAEDVTQEAMVRAWRALAQLRSGSARTWLLRIVRNTAYTHLDRRKRSMNVVSLDQAARRRDQEGRSLDFADTAPNAEAELIRADEQAALAAALDALPLQLKETIVLREMEGLSYREIAAVTEAPVGTVMSRLARARERLRRALVAPPSDGGRFHAL